MGADAVLSIMISKAAVEAVLFASGEPVSIDRLAETFDADTDALDEVVSELIDEYNTEEHGIHLIRLGGSVQFSTKEEYSLPVQNAMEIHRNTPLSQAAMEVLSIIAYNQPVTKGFIEQVRGVESGQIVNNLAEKGLVEEAGRLPVPGRPITYRTSLQFLRCFGLSSIEELPPLPDRSEQESVAEMLMPENDQYPDDSELKDG